MHFSKALSISIRRLVGALVVFLALPASAFAQSAKDSSFYAKAQQMVANGDAVNGRKLVDSVAAAAPAGTPAFAEGLFWRATLASNARDSEQEYRQIIVDYPLSGRVSDALLRIGQLEAARGENAAALQHFQRLVLEHPTSPLRPEGSYWVARMYFDANDATRACTANNDALANVKASNIELKNRIDFQQQRCRGVALATNPTPNPTTNPVTAAPPKANPRTPAKTAPQTMSEKSVESKAVPEKKTPEKVVAPRVEEKKEVANAAPVPPSPPAPRPPPQLSTPVATSVTDSTGVVSRQPTKEEVDRALASATQPVSSKAPKAAGNSSKRETAAPVESSAPPPAPRPATRGAGSSYAIQVAAFGTKAPANQLAAKLRGRGYVMFVDGVSAPYRVRLGNYPTQSAAAKELAKLKAKHIDGFVVER
ncbi:MAG: SPOR domain-containing protein [Gemmatimonadaceae bacterium]